MVYDIIEMSMATTENNLHVSDDLLAELTAKAAAEGRSVDELAEAELRKALSEQSWQGLLARGRKYGKAAGMTEDQVPEVVRDWRSEQRGRS
jgi:plasmid stability protein